MIRKTAWTALVGGVATLLLAPAAAWFLDSRHGLDVQMITPLDGGLVALNKAGWFRGEDVVQVYGIANGGRIRIVFPESSRIIVPEEDPALLLYTVDKQKGENPLQARTLWFFSKWFMIGGGAAALAGLAGVKLLGTGRPAA